MFVAAAHPALQGCLYALLAAGALPTSTCRLGNSALHVAACNGSLQAIRCLAAAGVPLTARNRLGQTPRQVRLPRQAIAKRAQHAPGKAVKPPDLEAC